MKRILVWAYMYFRVNFITFESKHFPHIVSIASFTAFHTRASFLHFVYTEKRAHLQTWYCIISFVLHSIHSKKDILTLEFGSLGYHREYMSNYNRITFMALFLSCTDLIALICHLIKNEIFFVCVDHKVSICTKEYCSIKI